MDDEDDFSDISDEDLQEKKPGRENNRPERIVSPSMMKHAICLISSLMVLLAAVIIACAILSNKTINVNCSKNIDSDIEITTSEPHQIDHQWIM